MARSMNQTLAWITSGVLSIALFGAGYAAFKVMVKGGAHGPSGSDHDAHGDVKARHDEGHTTQAVAPRVEAKPDHEVPKKEEPGPDHHGAETHQPADDAAPHGESADHQESGDEEISADQFKSKSEPH